MVMEVAKLNRLIVIALWAFLSSSPQSSGGNGNGNNGLLFAAAEAYGNTYVVGDDAGWSFIDKIKGQPQDFGAWASNHTFFVNDVLVFNYDPHAENVYSFDDVKDWQSCNMTAGKLLDDGSSGSSQWYLPSEGYYDFASGIHCSEGQKFRIYAVNASAMQGSNDSTASAPSPPPENGSPWMSPMFPPIPRLPPLPPFPAFPPASPPPLIELPPTLPPAISSPWPTQEGAWAPVGTPSSYFATPPSPPPDSESVNPDPIISDIAPSGSNNESDIPASSPSYVGSFAPALSPLTLADGASAQLPYPRAYYLLGAVLTMASLKLISHY